MQTRSSNRGMEKTGVDLGESAPGGGGSAERAEVPGGRGGYPISCTAFSFSNFSQNSTDPRLIDLAHARVAPQWRQVAAHIGVDKYLAIAALFTTQSGKAASERRVNLPSLLRLARHAAGPDQLDFFDATAADRGAEIKSCGMPHLWLATVKYLGVDDFLAMLGILSMDPHAVTEGRINAPGALGLYQVTRNAYVRRLLSRGLQVLEVLRAVQVVLGDRLTKMRIYQIRTLMRETETP